MGTARQATFFAAMWMSIGAMMVGCNKEVAKPAPIPPAVTVAKPVIKSVSDFGSYRGKFVATDEVQVKAIVRGYLKEIHFKDGQEVKKDDLLFELDPEPFDIAIAQAEGKVKQVTARKVTAAAEVKRYEDLVPKGAATKQDLDRAIGQLGEADAGMQSAAAEVDDARKNKEYSRITARWDGLASKSTVSKGALIGATGTDTTLTTIVKLDPIYVEFDVDERAAQAYRARAGASRPTSIRDLDIQVQIGLASDDGTPHEGVIDFIDNQVDKTTGTIKVRAEVKNPGRVFRPGYDAKVRVPTGAPYDAVLVADRAVATQQDTKYVLTVDDQGKVKFRPVKLGTLQPGGLRVITEGITKDEWVIVNGMQRARPDSTVKAEKSEMPVRLPATNPAATNPAATQPAATQPADAAK